MNAVQTASPVILRTNSDSGGKNPRFLSASFRPDRGMRLLQVRAFFPGLGETDLLASPFPFDGALLIPFANRIRGQILPDGNTLETRVLDHTVTLPANWEGKAPNAEKCAMHGLILTSQMQPRLDGDEIAATLNAGDFEGHWLSRSDIAVRAVLRPESLEISATVRNAGTEKLPVGIGWHPYFALPGKRRDQARLHLPAKSRALVNNYDDVFPTGRIEPVSGTPYDFTAPGGAPLGTMYLDDCFLDLEKTPAGHTVIEILDPAVHYGLRIAALSPEVKAVQVYAPPDRQFVVVEPQFNYADPFSPVWPPGLDTGMVILEPDRQVTWTVKCELFVC